MGNTEISDSARSLSQVDLGEVEEELGFEFPEAVRRFYVATNGGVPDRAVFSNAGEEFLVNEFLSIRHGQKGLRVEDVYTSLTSDSTNPFPRFLVPIAMDPGGDFLCFSLRSNERGAVYAYRNEYFDNESEAVVFLAASLDQFLDGLMAS